MLSQYNKKAFLQDCWHAKTPSAQIWSQCQTDPSMARFFPGIDSNWLTRCKLITPQRLCVHRVVCQDKLYMENCFSRTLKVMIHRQLLLFHKDQYFLQQGRLANGTNQYGQQCTVTISTWISLFKIISTCESDDILSWGTVALYYPPEDVITLFNCMLSIILTNGAYP